jgi:ligand-binding sensor domain-containing protein
MSVAPLWLALAVYLFVALLCAPANALDPSLHVSQYGHTAWRVQDGYLSAGVFAITQTVDGYLWIGTQNGLVRFDGVRFIPWVPSVGQHLPSSIITSLLGPRDGSLWIGTTSGLSRWVNQKLTDMNVHEQVSYIVEDRKGTIWFNHDAPAAGAPLCQIVGIGTGVRCYGKAEGVPDDATALAEDGQGNLWIGGSSAVVRWNPDSQSVYTTKELQSNNGQSGVTGLAEDRDGSMWVGMTFSGSGSKLQKLAQGRMETVSSAPV